MADGSENFFENWAWKIPVSVQLIALGVSKPLIVEKLIAKNIMLKVQFTL